MSPIQHEIKRKIMLQETQMMSRANRYETGVREEQARGRGPSKGDGGWALLGLLLALGVMSIVMASAIVPNVRVQVQRDKEAEMLYRGDQMARGIARYYNAGQLAGIQLVVPPPYGYLTELKKLRDGIRLNVRELKFVSRRR
jgi:type II secretory pathway pseudopilin PulG